MVALILNFTHSDVIKKNLSMQEIKSQPTKWNILEENTKDRNGFMVCVRS